MTERIDKAMEHAIEYLAPSDSPTEADAIFLFGNYTLSIPEKGAQLFHSGYAPLIVANGLRGHISRQHQWNVPIAEKYTSHLLAADIPSKAILTSLNSANTLKHVIQGMPTLIERSTQLNRIIVITIFVHQRHAWATLCQHYPDFEYINILVAEDISTPAKKWRVVSRAVGEILRLQRYAEKGDIISQDILPDIFNACNILSKWIGDEVY